MKHLVLLLLSVGLVACNPMGKTDDDESGPQTKTSKSATPTPAPKPGDWMEKKKIGQKLNVKEDKLGIKGDRLDEPVKK